MPAAPPPDEKNVLDLEVRRLIVEAVRENPGTHLRALSQLLDIPLSTLEYHCYQLVRFDQLTTREGSGFKAYYPSEGLDRRDKDILYLVRHDAPRRICIHLIENPGSTPKDLKGLLDLGGPTVAFHVKKLREGGVVREEPAGRTKKLFLVEPERVASVLVTYRQSFVDDAVDRFAEVWLQMHPPQ